MLIFRSSRMVAWHHAMFTFLLRYSPGGAIGYILAYTSSKILRLLALLAPLKIIFLARSPGVPSYLQSVMVEEDKKAWIIALAVGTIVMYLFTVLLDAYTKSVANKFAAKLAADEAVSGSDEKQVHSYFSRIGQGYGDLLYLLVLFSGGLAFNPKLFGALILAIFIHIVAIGVWIDSRGDATPDERDKRLSEFWSSYAGVFNSLTFLSGFAILLVQIMFTDSQDMYLGIIVIIILRQLSGAVGSYGSHGIWLWQNKAYITAMLDDAESAAAPPPGRVQQLTRYYKRKQRDERVVTWLEEAGVTAFQNMRSRWRDANNSQVVMYLIRGKDISERDQVLLHRIDFGRRMGQLEREDVLAGVDPNVALPRPKLIGRWKVAKSVSTLLELDPGEFVTKQTYSKSLQMTLPKLWGTAVPEALTVRDLRTAEMPDLGKIDWSVLNVAVDDKRDVATVRQITEHATTLQAILNAMPQCIVNDQMKANNFYLTEEGEALLLDWTSWSVAPVGTGLHLMGKREKFVRKILDENTMPQRGEFELQAAHLLLAGAVVTLHEDLKKQRYRAALDRIPDILSYYKKLQT